MPSEEVRTSDTEPDRSLAPLHDATDATATRLAEQCHMVEQALGHFVDTHDPSPPRVLEAMRYSLFAGGKRLRPILVFAGAEVAGMAPDGVLPAACAVELIHTYALVHDDLPAMDDAPTRRGKPACHIVYGEAIAMLTGDALQALAFELLARNAQVPGVSADRVVKAIAEVARGVGVRGMVGGQALDVLASRDPTAVRDLREIHRLKTGSFIQACVHIGGLLGGASAGDLDSLGRYGTHIGLAFQIVDDILDVVGDETKLGKGAGSDAAQAKVTFPSAFGLAASRRLARGATADAIAVLEPLGERGRWLQDLAIFLLSRDR